MAHECEFANASYEYAPFCAACGGPADDCMTFREAELTYLANQAGPSTVMLAAVDRLYNRSASPTELCGVMCAAVNITFSYIE